MDIRSFCFQMKLEFRAFTGRNFNNARIRLVCGERFSLVLSFPFFRGQVKRSLSVVELISQASFKGLAAEAYVHITDFIIQHIADTLPKYG